MESAHLSVQCYTGAQPRSTPRVHEKNGAARPLLPRRRMSRQLDRTNTGTVRRQRRSTHGAIWLGAHGFLFGFLLLHPISMLIFRWLDPRLAQGVHQLEMSLLTPLLHSFHLDMAPMGLVFGTLGGVVGLAAGRYRARLARQRDELAEQAQALAARNEHLAKLEQANRRHTQFMVHDFKGHLATIGGFTEHLLEKDSRWAPEDREALTRIRRQTQRMSAAVMDLLQFARLQESPTLRRTDTSVSHLLETVAADVTLPAHLGRVELGPGRRHCPDVSVDAPLVERVLVNLVLNALKHNRPGTRVVIDAHVRSPGEVAFTCADDGCGISPEALSTLFQEFGNVGASSHDDSTGLGLAFCKKAIEAHGGRIWCESSSGRGARFTFTVPTGAQRSEQWQAQRSEGSSSSTTSPISLPT